MPARVKLRTAAKSVRLGAVLLFGSSAVAAGSLAVSGTALAAPAAPAAAHVASVARPQFSQKSAASWALAHVNIANRFSDDCADFVSQALQAAGYPFSYVPSVLTTDSTNDKYWYYETARFTRYYSHSWSVARDLAVHLIDMKSKRITNPANAKPGDIIFANWKGTNFSGISHVGIITAMSKGLPLITQHSPSQKNVSILYWVHHGGPNVHVWIYRPNP